MKFAIAASGTEMSSPVDDRFGRAAYFIIGDTESNNHEVLENSANVAAAHGAGTGTAQELVSRNVKVVVAGKFGPKAEQVLSAAGIDMVSFTGGTVTEAIDRAVQRQTPGAH